MDNSKQLVQLGKRVRSRRMAKNWTLGELGKTALIPVGRLKRIETGEVNIRYYTLVRILQALDG